MRNEPLLNRCVHKRWKIKDTFLCSVTQQTFGQRTALERRSWKKDRPHTPAHASKVCLLPGSVDACYATCHRIRSNLFHEYASAIFPRKPFAREQSRTQKPGRMSIWIFQKRRNGRWGIRIDESGVGLCVGERTQQAFITIKTGEYDQDPPAGGDPQCSEAI